MRSIITKTAYLNSIEAATPENVVNSIDVSKYQLRRRTSLLHKDKKVQASNKKATKKALTEQKIITKIDRAIALNKMSNAATAINSDRRGPDSIKVKRYQEAKMEAFSSLLAVMGANRRLKNHKGGNHG